jgi:hypothetical protein
MTSRDSSSPLHRTLVRHHRAVLRAWALRSSFPAAASAALAIAAAVVLGAFLPLGETAATVRLVLVVAASAGFVVLAVRRYRARAHGFDTHLEHLEERFPEMRSWLRNALDFGAHPPHDTSAELASALTAETARRLDGTPIQSMVPRLEPRRPGLLLLASMVLVLVAGLLFPQRVGRSWETLWNPALAAPPVRLEVEPGSVRVTPGAALTVHARVWGSPRVPALLRSGDATLQGTAEGRGDHSEQLWRFDLTQLTREQDYRVRVAHTESPRYRIALAGDPAPVSFQIEYVAPAYSRLPVQRGAATRGDLSALRGTRASVEVTFDRDLDGVSATILGARPAAWTELTPRRWRGQILVDREGDYQLEARAASGQARLGYRISPMPDAPPVLAVRTPSNDLDLPAGQQVPLEITGQDDLGLSELKLHYRKDADGAWTQVPLAHFGGEPREASVSSRWDASSLGLLPGQTATFRFELIDGNTYSGRGRTLSPTFELRFPSLTDLYDNLDRTQSGVQTSLEKVAEQAKELQKSLDKLSRQQQNRSSEESPSFERSEEMKSALERQQEITDRIEQAASELHQTLEHAAERQAFNDELTRKLKEMSELMQQIQSQEFREALRRMQEAMQKMDRQALEQNLPDWRQENKQMLENLERSIDLLKQLRREEKVDGLAKRAAELKRQQDQLNREHAARENKSAGQDQKTESQALAQQQQHAADQTEKLAKEARDLAQELQKEQKSPSEPNAQKLEKAAEQLDPGASEEQKQASESADQQQSKSAKQHGQSASQKLDQAGQQLQQMAESMRQEREGADLASIRRAAQDLVSLQREAEGNLRSAAPLPQRSDRQTDLSEGASRVADSLYMLSRKTPFITPQLSEKLGRAINGLSQSGKEMASGNRMRGEESGRSGGAALNEAVLELRRTENSMCQNPGATGSKPKQGSSAQRLGDLGEKQSQLNQETRTLSQRLSEQMRLSSGDRQQLQRYAEEQRRLREQLEQIQKDDEARRELLGRLDAAKREMKDVEESLESGSVGSDLEERQNRILSRLLDASRSVHRRDFDPEREARRGEDVIRPSAPEISPELLRENDRLRLDLLKAEADRYPAQYRAFIEAYLRKLNGARR